MNDLTNLSLRDVAFIEEKSGQSIASFADEAAPKGLLLASLAYIMKRRELREQGMPVSTFTWENALDLSVDEATAMLGLDEVEVADSPFEQSA